MVFATVVVPYLLDALRRGIREPELSLFQFIERMASQGDSETRNVVRNTLCPAIVREGIKAIEEAKRYLGPSGAKLLVQVMSS